MKSKKQCNKTKRFFGGDGQSGTGHDVSMPSEYFGVNSGSYFPAGSAELGPYQTAYDLQPVDGKTTFGHNLAPGSLTLQHSGLQTGGGKKRNSPQRQGQEQPQEQGQGQRRLAGSGKRKRRNSKSKKSGKSGKTGKKQGGVWGNIMNEALKLTVPLGLYGAKTLVDNYVRKPKREQQLSELKKSFSKAKSFDLNVVVAPSTPPSPVVSSKRLLSSHGKSANKSASKRTL